MAKEAILKIKQAEDGGNDQIARATESAKLTIRSAESDCEARQKEIIGDANKKRADMMEKSRQQAVLECEPLIKEAESEISKISNPDQGKFDKTVNLIVERIVNGNGSC